MTTGFDNPNVLLLHRPGQSCQLPDGFAWWWRGHEFVYISNDEHDAYTDGLSSPQFAHCLPGLNPYGWTLPAAVAHDAGYHRGIRQLTPDGWKDIALTKDDCDLMLYELLLALAGEDEGKKKLALVIYESVHLFGKEAWAKAKGANE